MRNLGRAIPIADSRRWTRLVVSVAYTFLIMCGRYTVGRPGKVVSKLMNREIAGPVSLPVYNASPGQRLPVVLDSDPQVIVPLLWGLRTEGRGRPGRMLINARAETVHVRPTFRDSFRHRRCLVIADGFYEWQRVGGGKQPFRITLVDGGLFTFAGIWLEGAGEPAFVILTTNANGVTRPIHDRMPVILDDGHQGAWLDPATRSDSLRSLLEPCPEERLTAYPVSTAVNNWRNEGPELIAALAPGRSRTVER